MQEIRKRDIVYSTSLIITGFVSFVALNPWRRIFGVSTSVLNPDNTLSEVIYGDFEIGIKAFYLAYYVLVILTFLLGVVSLLLLFQEHKNSSFVSGISSLTSLGVAVLGFSLFSNVMPWNFLPLTLGLISLVSSGLHFATYFPKYIGERMEKKALKELEKEK